ncbi:MAG: basic amino acid ABC transporter substrate-binding protein [Eubacterium sp.]|nr:basic amino acid ABC transporter substrate-binding protein [Eubacterium sp.]
MKKSAVVLLLAVTMAFTGCGEEKDASQNADTSADEKVDLQGGESDTQSENRTDLGEDANAADANSDVLADGVLNVGTNAEFPPFEFVGDDGEPDGFDMALVKAIAEKLGVEVQVENMEFDSLVASIGSKIDIAIAGMTVTDERKAMVDFSDNYYEAVQYVIVPADSDIAQAADLEGKNIGVQLGTTGDFIVEDIKDATASQYNKAVDAVNDLRNGRVDAVIIDKNPAQVFGEQFKDEVKLFDGESPEFGFEKEYYAIAMPKGDEALAKKINDALAELKSDGTFDELVSQYIGN